MPLAVPQHSVQQSALLVQMSVTAWQKYAFTQAPPWQLVEQQSAPVEQGDPRTPQEPPGSCWHTVPLVPPSGSVEVPHSVVQQSLGPEQARPTPRQFEAEQVPFTQCAVQQSDGPAQEVPAALQLALHTPALHTPPWQHSEPVVQAAPMAVQITPESVLLPPSPFWEPPSPWLLPPSPVVEPGGHRQLAKTTPAMIDTSFDRERRPISTSLEDPLLSPALPGSAQNKLMQVQGSVAAVQLAPAELTQTRPVQQPIAGVHDCPNPSQLEV